MSSKPTNNIYRPEDEEGNGGGAGNVGVVGDDDDAPMTLKPLWWPFSSWSSCVPPAYAIPSQTVSRETTSMFATREGGGTEGDERHKEERQQQRQKVEDACDEWLSFVTYLLSDDTRLPPHPLLTVTAADPTDYTSYTGEEVWEKNGSEGEEGNVDERRRSSRSIPSYTKFVDYLRRAMVELNKGSSGPRADDSSYGLVLCGEQCGTCDDCSWACTSRTLRCASSRDLWHTMRSSTKFLTDLDQQLEHYHQESSAHHDDVDEEDYGEAKQELQFHVRQHIEVAPCYEFRIFLRAKTTRRATTGAVSATKCTLRPTPTLEVLGVCQRHIDQVFQPSATYSVNEHCLWAQYILGQLGFDAASFCSSCCPHAEEEDAASAPHLLRSGAPIIGDKLKGRMLDFWRSQIGGLLDAMEKEQNEKETVEGSSTHEHKEEEDPMMLVALDVLASPPAELLACGSSHEQLLRIVGCSAYDARGCGLRSAAGTGSSSGSDEDNKEKSTVDAGGDAPALFRLFGSFSDLLRYKDHHSTTCRCQGNRGEDLDDNQEGLRMVPFSPTQPILVARSMSDLRFDPRLSGLTSGGGNAALPTEFQHPELLSAAGLPLEVQEMMRTAALQGQN